MVAGVGAFLTFPLDLSSTAEIGSLFVGATQVFVAAGCGILLLVARNHTSAGRKFWIATAMAALVSLIISFFLYVFLQASWTCPYVNATKLVIGSDPTQELVNYLQRADGRSICNAVFDFAGDTFRMFLLPGLLIRFLLLGLTYVTAWLSLAGVVISIGVGLARK
jgi:hypothetical protein